MTTTNTPANHIDCELGDGPIRRGEAVIRSNGRRQIGYHKACYTIHRAVKDVAVAEITAEESGLSLTARLERAGIR